MGSLLTMGIATFIVGVLPTYQQVGVAAPLLLAIMRFSQGLALGAASGAERHCWSPKPPNPTRGRERRCGHSWAHHSVPAG